MSEYKILRTKWSLTKIIIYILTLVGITARLVFSNVGRSARLRSFFCTILLVSIPMLLLSQSTIINLKNSSFEGLPQHSHTPKDWYDCGFPGETPPDTHPDATFKVLLPAYDGNTYLGLVVRDNNTWESVSQKLGTPLLPNQCYELSFFAARSEIYRSLSSTTGEEVDYNTPAILRIWGGSEYCDQAVFLTQTEPITDTDWQEITVTLKPTGKNKCTYIIIEAYYSDDNSFAYNGNILLDNIQPIVLCNNGAKQ